MGEKRALYLIRHGQTEWNLEGRLQGGKDSPLTVLGRQQANGVAISLKVRPPSLILASPLGRARKTAEIIAKALDISIEKDDRLGELRFGAAEGLTLKAIDERWPDFRARREQNKWSTRWPDGESCADANQRISSYVADTLSHHLEDRSDAPLAVVGHETMNMILMGRLLDLDPSMVTQLSQPNHVVYRIDGRLVDHAHLGDDDLEWIPGMLQKRSEEILHIAA
ncbi:MAG: histidine phosphatase family protein [Geminicoccaceae bacterium]